MNKDIKKLQKEILEIYSDVLPLFELHNINFTANGGTCIGACREGGFIEGDDDLDLNIMPYDMEKLYILLANLPNGYQGNEPIRGIIKIEKVNPSGNGKRVFIDLIINSYASKPRKATILLCKILTIHFTFNGSRLDGNNYNKWYLKGPIRLLTFGIPTPFSRWLYKFVMISKNKAYVSETSYYNWGKKSYQKTSFFDARKKMKFEDTYIYVPLKYDEYLTQYFGDGKTPVNWNQDHYK